MIMSDFTGPGPEQRDVDDEVGEGLRGELADELALAGRLDLEAAEGAGGAHQPVGRLVVQRDGVQVDPPVAGVEVAGVGRGARPLPRRRRRRRARPR